MAYYSQTGNTEKIARAIYNAIPVAKEIKPVDEVESAQGYDIIFCGFPVHAHGVPGKAQPFIKGLPAGQKIAFFSTHGSLRGGQLPKQAFEEAQSAAGHPDAGDLEDAKTFAAEMFAKARPHQNASSGSSTTSRPSLRHVSIRAIVSGSVTSAK